MLPFLVVWGVLRGMGVVFESLDSLITLLPEWLFLVIIAVALLVPSLLAWYICISALAHLSIKYPKKFLFSLLGYAFTVGILINALLLIPVKKDAQDNLILPERVLPHQAQSSFMQSLYYCKRGPQSMFVLDSSGGYTGESVIFNTVGITVDQSYWDDLGLDIRLWGVAPSMNDCALVSKTQT